MQNSVQPLKPETTANNAGLSKLLNPLENKVEALAYQYPGFNNSTEEGLNVNESEFPGSSTAAIELAFAVVFKSEAVNA